MPVNHAPAPQKQAPKPSSQQKENVPNRATEQKTASSAPPTTKKKMGLAVALLLVLVASSYDTLDILTTFIIGDDYWILDILYFPTTIGFWLYFRMKKINKRGLYLLAYLAEWIPIVDIINLQTAWALVIIWTNMTKRGEKAAGSTAGLKVSPLPNAA